MEQLQRIQNETQTEKGGTEGNDVDAKQNAKRAFGTMTKVKKNRNGIYL